MVPDLRSLEDMMMPDAHLERRAGGSQVENICSRFVCGRRMRMRAVVQETGTIF